ncbi:hypothetical protein [Nonomuraea sp. NPDC049400]|uniref:hypothetical protein n=1 Tax=Nonomuraea sp. NPDC049400 TaxID=3364352 RepID=UPI0037A136AB
MDELDLLARSLPDAPPPSAEVVERARARLAAAQHEPTRPSLRFGPARRRFGWGWTLGTAVVTIAVVMAVVTLVSNMTAVPAPVLVPPARGNDALRRLADQVAKLPDDSGAYWRKSLAGDYLVRVRAGGETFNALGTLRSEFWVPHDPKDPVQTQHEESGLRPATPEDERTWRAAGSPAKVQRVCTPGTRAADCPKVPMGSKRVDCQYTRAVEPDGVLGDRRFGDLTMAELAALPTDDRGLRTWVRAHWDLRRPGKQTDDEVLPRSRHLLEMAIRPAARAAVLRLLADLPTTTVRGRAADPLGRPGLEVDFIKGNPSFAEFGKDDEVTEDHTTILDLRTGMILADVTAAGESTEGLPKGAVMRHTAWVPGSGWTDDRPEQPRGCRAVRSVR